MNLKPIGSWLNSLAATARQLKAIFYVSYHMNHMSHMIPTMKDLKLSLKMIPYDKDLITNVPDILLNPSSSAIDLKRRKNDIFGITKYENDFHPSFISLFRK